MPVASRLLMIPAKIRRRIYSYMLLNEDIKDMMAANVTRPQEAGLFLSCRKLYFEAFEYYYDANTFQLSLCDPTYSLFDYCQSDRTTVIRLSRIRNLHVEIGPSHATQYDFLRQARLSLDYKTETYNWDQFTKLLLLVHRRKAGLLLKRLVIIDRFTHALLDYPQEDQSRPRRPLISHSVPEKRIIDLTSLAIRFLGKVGSLTVEIRSTYVWTPYMSIDDCPYTVLRSSPVLPLERSQ